MSFATEASVERLEWNVGEECLNLQAKTFFLWKLLLKTTYHLGSLKEEAQGGQNAFLFL